MFRLGELFSGPGGLARGAINADIGNDNFRIVHAWANDYDESTCETYRNNICRNNPGSVICGDVRQLKISPDNLAHIDALAFGFPCNDFSTVGEQRGFRGTYGPLYTYGVRALTAFNPQWFLAENVSGLSSANGGNAFPKILADLRAAGYRIYPHKYKFEKYGVPQSRHRIIIIGIRDDLEFEFRPPAPTTPDPKDYVTVEEVFNRPMPADVSNNEMPRMTQKVIDRLNHILPGHNAFNSRLPKELQLNVKGAKISQIYRRLDPHKPSYTVTGSGGGGTHIYHYSEPRALTNRERARLQTFPDDYKFVGTKENVRRQIGMAVPCHGAQLIFEAIMRTFAGIEYASVPCNISFDNTIEIQQNAINIRDVTQERLIG